MKINALQLIIIFLIIGVISIFAPSAVFADAHETEGDMAPEAEAMEEKPGVSGWFQIDIDSLGTYFLIGASHPIGGISIASNIYVNDSHNGKLVGEFDLGVTVPVLKGDDLSLALQPMLGVGFDYRGADGPDALFPQFFAFLNAPNIFFFHWTIASLYSPFGEAGALVTHSSNNEKVEHGTIPLSDVIYTRNYITYSLNDTIAIGPQFELLTSMENVGEPINLNFGGRINIAYGTANTLGIYVGYETKKGDDETGLTGRMNFTRFW